jgi:hypothetical protein
MAATLGVAPGDLKVVSVYEGSAVVVVVAIRDEEIQETPVDLTAV